jgi:hypothetical protein
MYNGAATAYQFTSQLYFDESITRSIFSMSPYNLRPNRDTTNSTDGIYSGGGSGAQLLLRVAQDGSYGMSSFHVALNV